MTNRRTHGLLLLIAMAAAPAAAQQPSPRSAISPAATISDVRTGTLEELRTEANAYGGNWQWTVIGPTRFAQLGDSSVGSAIGAGLT
ncbi:MAG: hypothetical protein ACRDJ9_31520, partial [Dehalococcoidia bacterium]